MDKKRQNKDKQTEQVKTIEMKQGQDTEKDKKDRRRTKCRHQDNETKWRKKQQNNDQLQNAARIK